MVNRKGAAKILLWPAFSHNQNGVDARTQFEATQHIPNRKIADNRSHTSISDFWWVTETRHLHLRDSGSGL